MQLNMYVPHDVACCCFACDPNVFYATLDVLHGWNVDNGVTALVWIHCLDT